MKPEQIESLSFKIIDEEAGPHHFTDDQWTIVRRMIHTSADFEFMHTVRIHPDAVASGLKAICSGKPIITDTNMARVGIRTRDLARYGVAVKCYMNDPQVHKIATENGITRAQAAVDYAASMMRGGIYVVGNAPTALLRLVELVQAKSADPALIVGLPVGFVNASESKAALMKIDCPCITNIGRKGGSNIAASVVNALIILAGQTG